MILFGFMEYDKDTIRVAAGGENIKADPAKWSKQRGNARGLIYLLFIIIKSNIMSVCNLDGYDRRYIQEMDLIINLLNYSLN